MTADPDQLVTLTTARTEFEGRTKAAVLEDEGIPAKVFAAAANALQWEGGYTDPIKIMVRRGDVERANAILSRNRQDSVDIDWAEVEVGSLEPDAPPVAPREARNRWTWRRRTRYIGFVLLGMGFFVPMLAPTLAIPVLIGAIIIIAASWNDDFGPRPNTPPPKL